jgi:hypothetical protein
MYCRGGVSLPNIRGTRHRRDIGEAEHHISLKIA